MTSLRISALVVLLSGATLLAPAQAVDQLPSGWVPTSNLYLDLADKRPGALLEYQMQALTSDIDTALEQFERHYHRLPTSLAELQSAELLPFLPLAANGQSLRLVALANDELPQAGELGLQFRPDEVNIYAMGADGDPMSPLVKPVHFRKQTAALSLSFPLEQRRLLALRGALERALNAYYQLTGEFPADWSTLASTLGWTLSPGYTLDGPPPSLAVRIDRTRQAFEMERTPALGHAPRMRHALRASGPHTYLRQAPHLLLDQSIHPSPWQTFGVARHEPALASLPAEAPTLLWSESYLGSLNVEVAELEVILPEFYALHQRLPTVAEVEDLISTRVMWDGKPLPFLNLPDITVPMPADPMEVMRVREAHLQSEHPAIVWVTAGTQFLIGSPRPPIILPLDFPREQRELLEAHFKTQGHQALVSSRPLQSRQSSSMIIGGPPFEDLPIPTPATPQVAQDDWVERWLNAQNTEDGIRLKALYEGAKCRLHRYLREYQSPPDSWEAIDQALGLVPLRYRYIGSLDELAPGETGIALEVATVTPRLARITLQSPAGSRRQQYIADSRTHFISLGQQYMTSVQYPEYAAQEFTLIGAVVLDPIQEAPLP